MLIYQPSLLARPYEYLISCFLHSFAHTLSNSALSGPVEMDLRGRRLLDDQRARSESCWSRSEKRATILLSAD